MNRTTVTLGVPSERQADLEAFLLEEGLDWQIVAEGAGTLNISEGGTEPVPCTKQSLVTGGRIDCSTALAMAEELRADTRAIGKLMNLLGIRIRNCQLGCFP